MATARQKKALNAILENPSKLGQAMVKAGYAKNTSIAPTKNLLEAKGFIELCEERGLTEDFLVDALVEDIQNKPQNRKPEIELGFKVRGRLSDRPEGNKTLIINIPNEVAKSFNIDATNTETSGGDTEQE